METVENVPGQSVHPLTATLFVKELTASLWAEIPRRAKWIGVALFTFIAMVICGAFLFGMVTLVRLTNKTEGLRDQVAAEKAERDKAQELINKQALEIDRLREVSDQMRRSTQKIAEYYSPGVCLIVGSYKLVENAAQVAFCATRAPTAFMIRRLTRAVPAGFC